MGDELPAAGPAEFRTSGRTLVFDGNIRVYQRLRKPDDQEQALPALSEGMPVECLELLPTQHFTKPPPRYTEASLVKTLEKKGIGRPSTYAQIITTIQDRGYVEVRDKAFYANELGIVTNDTLLPFFGNVINTEFTAQLEDHLDDVEAGARAWRDVLEEFYEPFKADLERAADEMPNVKQQLAEETDEVCDKCGAPMVIRLSKRGRFLACSAFPKCRNTRALDANGEPVEVETLDEKCPECGEPLAVRTGRRGKFIGCTGFPKCRYTREVAGEAGGEEAPKKPTAEPTGEDCPQCGKPLVVRTGRRGKFIGCSGYPECRHTENIEEQAPEG